MRTGGGGCKVHLAGAEGRCDFAHGGEGGVDGHDEVAVGVRAQLVDAAHRAAGGGGGWGGVQ